jgi:ketosteroid isomerase-like protein
MPLYVALALVVALLVAPDATAQSVPAHLDCAHNHATPDHHPQESDFALFLDRLDVAIEEFTNGDAAAFKAAWAHTDDVTVAGGFGGEIVQGWDTLGPRLSGVAATYTDTEFSTRRIAARASGDLAYVIQHEYFRRGEAAEPYRQYRVTMLFRCEAGEWRLFHRHADSQMDFRVPD